MKEVRKSGRGKAAKKLYENTNPNMVDCKGLTELSPLGLPQLSVGSGANLGKHSPRHHIYANDYYSS